MSPQDGWKACVESAKVVLEYYDPSLRLVYVPDRADIFWLAQKMILKIPETCLCVYG